MHWAISVKRQVCCILAIYLQDVYKHTAFSDFHPIVFYDIEASLPRPPFFLFITSFLELCSKVLLYSLPESSEYTENSRKFSTIGEVHSVLSWHY